MDMKALTAEHRDLVIKTRRDLHRIPEIGFKEKKTSAYVAHYLKKVGLPFQTGIAKYGVVGLLETGRPGPTLMIRADMDALPVAEETGLSFASKHPGVMHACGHDAHTAMALCTATILNRIKDQFNGRIKFVFQPAEEGPGGAKPMIEQGVMEDPDVDYVLGCHVWPDIPEGTIGVREGPLLAAMFLFDINIKGKGGHGATPHHCVDALETGCQVVSALQRIVSRKSNPMSPTVVTVGSFHSGTVANVIPGTATLSGTARTFDKTTWNHWPDIIGPVVAGVCNAMGAECEITYAKGYPPTINDQSVSDLVRRCAARVVGSRNVVVPEKTLGGEDMAYFLEKARGCFFCLGAGADQYASIHNPMFDFNEAILLNGVETMCRSALEILGTREPGQGE